LTNAPQQQWGTAVGTGDWWFWWTIPFGAFIMDAAEKKVLLDSPEMVRMTKWYFSELLPSSPTPEEQKQLDSPDKLFAQGKLGLLQLGSWVFGPTLTAVADQFEWTLQEAPTGPDGKKRVAASARALCAPKFTKAPDAVWTFMRYWAFTPQAARWLGETGNVPVVRSAAGADAYVQPNVLGGAKRVFVRGMEYAVFSLRQYPPGIELYGFQKPYNDALAAILDARGQGIEAALRQAQEQMQRLADEHWQRVGDRKP
jgi:ABC-type glycerol-3-phosphate transport system substrate-binding protein